LESETYRIKGILDEVESLNGFYYPVEYKKGASSGNLSHHVQLCLQGLLLEESLEMEIEKGYLYYVADNIKEEVFFTQELRDLALSLVDQAFATIEDHIIPESVNDHRCVECSLSSICMPFETAKLKQETTGMASPSVSQNLGRTLYVDTPGAYLHKSGGEIVVTKDKEKLHDIPISSVDRIIILSGVSISSQLLFELLRRNIPAYFSETSGKTLGWLSPMLGKNNQLRMQQLTLSTNEAQSLLLSKAFVTGKVKNMRTLLMRYNRTLNNPVIENSIVHLKKSLEYIENATSQASLLGYEGDAARHYFMSFEKLLHRTNNFFEFDHRTKRPPKDPVNAVLSYTYTLLSFEVLSEISRVGLDPYIGFYHSNKYGRPSLALDLMEEFRQIIADSTTLTLINKQMLSEKDFEFKAGACLLNEQGRKTVLKVFRERIKEEVTHPIFDYKLTYRRTLEIQARILSKTLMGEYDHYTPFTVR
jgi:CRISPR-associated protein Cas1